MSELDKTIEELEAEVIAELEEAKSPKDGAAAAEKGGKLEGEVQDTGKPVVKPDQSDAPAKKVAAKAKEVSGEKPQKGEGKPDKPQKLAAGDEVEAEGEDLAETPKTKADHLEIFGKMKASEVKEMLKSYQSSLAEEDKDDDEEEEAEEEENLKKAKAEAYIKDIDVTEHVNALVSEEDELSEDFKHKAATIFEAAVKSKVRDEVDRILEDIKEEKDSELDTYKDELTNKVDNYLNYVVEEWTKDNELAIERGLKGEIAEDFISGLKQLFEDHYIDVPDEKYDVLEGQSDKIAELEDKLNEVIEKNIKLKETHDVLVKNHVIVEVSEDLADTEVEKLKSLADDVEFSDEENYREKLNTIKESYFPKVSKTSNVDDETTDGSIQDVDTTDTMKKYLSAISRVKKGAS